MEQLVPVNSALDLVASLRGIVPSSDSVMYTQNQDIIPIADWLSDPYYCGPIARDLYPFWREVLIEFEETEKNELILTGALSTGKSYSALALMLRKAYVLSCYRPISSYLGLGENSLVLFVYLAISVHQANLTGFGKLVKMVDSTPYFKERYPRDVNLNSVIKFKSGELTAISGSNIDHYRGGDLFGLIFDEGNFRKGSDKLKLSQAWDIYTESTNRRKTRFINGDIDRSFSIIVSSTDEASSFTEERIRESENDPTVMVVRATTWQTKPHRYSGKTFWVFKGTEKVDPFIEYDEDALGGYFSVIRRDPCPIDQLPAAIKSDWIKVPEELKTLFQSNLVRALADVAGIAVGGSDRLMKDEAAFNECFSVKNGRRHPFTRDRFVVSYQSEVRVEDFLLPDFMFDEGKEYFAHIDQSLTTDSTGLGISHKEVDSDGTVIIVDMMLKVDPPSKPDQISVRKIREFLIYLRDNRGCNLKLVTYDQFASAEAIQEMNSVGIEADRLSVDKDTAQYDFFVDMTLRRRVKGYYYAPFKEEFLFLEKDRFKRKVDHLPGRAKDVSDGVVGSVWNAQIHGEAGTDWLKLVNS